MWESLKKINPFGLAEYPKDYLAIIRNINEPLDEEAFNAIWRAYQFGNIAHTNQRRSSGEPYFTHCANVGAILAGWNLDYDTISAGLLHDTLEDTDVTKEDLAREFNPDIAELVDGVTKLSDIKFNSRQERQAENFMKMFLSVAKDIRVIIIKFADRLHNMRTIKHLPRIKQHRIALETREVYAPLAHRLGMGNLKLEFEDRCFEILENREYTKLCKRIKSSRGSREKYIRYFSAPIKKQLAEYNIHAEIYGRAKHNYSIYRKMQHRGLPFEEIYDLLAIRVIVDRIEDCYATLGIVHQIYHPIQERFKDYIATPKINGYRSLHTTVIAANGKMVEIQIRTHKMNETAEIGVAAHWAYKRHGSVKVKDTEMNRQTRWLRELVENLQSENKDPGEFLNLLKIDLFQEEIFVFTPKGDVVKLRLDSTPVDFAYEVHSQVGFHCTGAKVNGKIVPLNTRLRNGDTIEIITSASHTPSHTWLKFVQTAKAKTHIKKWIKKEQFEKSIKLGEEIVEKTLRRLKKISLLKEIKSSPQQMGYNTIDQLYSAIGSGQITVRDLVEKYLPPSADDKQSPDTELLNKQFLNRARSTAKGVNVGGIRGTLLNFGKCCNPIPGDEIVGYVTRGRGVTIHRNTCSNLPAPENEDRFIDVKWNTSKAQSFISRIKVVAEDRKLFLRDVSESISNLNINIVSVDIRTDEGVATGLFIIQVRDKRQLHRLIRKIRLIPGLIYLERI